MRLGLRLLERAAVPLGADVALLSDSQYALSVAAATAQVARYHALVFEVQDALARRGRLSLHYSPGHMGRVGGTRWGNDVADALASRAALSVPPAAEGPIRILTTSARDLLGVEEAALTPPFRGAPGGALPWCSKVLSQRLLHALAHGWAASDRARAWLKMKCLWVSSHSLDPLEARLSSSHWRLAGTAVWQVRRWLQARFGAFPGVNAMLHRMRKSGSPFCRAPGCVHQRETQAHLLGGCAAFRHFYVARSDRVVRRVASFLRRELPGLPFLSMGVSTTNALCAFPREIADALPAERRRQHTDLVIVTASRVELVEIAVTTASEPRTLLAAAEGKRLQYCDLLAALRGGASGERACSLTVLLFGATGLVPRATFCALAQLLSRLSGRPHASDAVDRGCAILQSPVPPRSEVPREAFPLLVQFLQRVSRALVADMVRLFGMRMHRAGGDGDG